MKLNAFLEKMKEEEARKGIGGGGGGTGVGGGKEGKGCNAKSLLPSLKVPLPSTTSSTRYFLIYFPPSTETIFRNLDP